MYAFFSQAFHLILTRGHSNSAVLLILVSFLLTGCASYTPPKVVSQASLTVSATSLNFKTVVLGQTVNQALHVANSGTAPLQISKLSISDPQFVITGPSVPRTVLPSMGLDYTLAFTPQSAGAASASLTIQSNALNSAAAVSLAGVGKR